MGKGNKAEQAQEDWLIAALKKTDRAKMRGKIERLQIKKPGPYSDPGFYLKQFQFS